MPAWLVRRAAKAKVKAVRNATIVKQLDAGTFTAQELSGRHGLAVGTIRGIFAAATGRPAPYAPHAIKCQGPFRRRSATYLRRRARAIVLARHAGVTLQALANRYGVTRERIRQIHFDATRHNYRSNAARGKAAS